MTGADNRPDEPQGRAVPEDHEDAVEEMLDEMAEETFPGSDPPSTWAGPDVPPADRRG